MKTLLLALALLGSVPLQAGTITGTVRGEGKPGAEADALCGKYDSRQFKFVERINYSEIHDFIVFIEGPVTGVTNRTEQWARVSTERIAQKGAMFMPHVLPVMVGTTVEWPNNDEILHNVFSMSDTTNFNLGLYKNPKIEKVTFNKPGRADVFCSIHSRMSCIVLVLENPFFTRTNEKGHYVIPDVPAGTYTVKAWHERIFPERKTVTVAENGEIKVDFVLGFQSVARN